MFGRNRFVGKIAAAGLVLVSVGGSAAPANAGLLGGGGGGGGLLGGGGGGLLGGGGGGLLGGGGGGLLGGVVGGVVGVVNTALDTTTSLLNGADWGYAPSQTSMSQVDDAIGAKTMWSRGYTGKGVGVALIDTGVVPVQGLTSGNVVNGPDLTFDSQSPSPDLDGFGHGTHMAGIIAGNDDTATGFKGVAPDATLLSVRVGASDGSADVSQVIAAIDWVVQHRNDQGMNIRVLNLSYGTDGIQPSMLDPLTHAVENAWRHGIVVVVAGGNAGSTQPSLDNPARDPYVVSVGADDINNTPGTSLDDGVPTFSSRGSITRQVDLVAPGQSIVSLRDPGSVIDTEYPSAVVNTRFFKGSGTSQATAVVSGAAALLLQQRPSLTPDQVKRLLVTTAQPVPLADAAGRGAGLLNVALAGQSSTPSYTQTWPVSTGLGTLEGARGTHHVGDNGVDLVGEQDIFGDPWVPSVWAPLSAVADAWNGGTWNGADWAGSCWCGTSWTGLTWDSHTWSSHTWSGATWSSHTWSDETWASHTWSGVGWVSHTWSSHTWSASGWS